MKISIIGIYKSLHPFICEQLPKLTVITGKNGSGKSQLIDLIKLSYLPKSTSALTIDPEPKAVQIEGISVPITTAVSNSNYRDMVTNFYNSFNKLSEDQKKLLDYIVKVKLFTNNQLIENDLRSIDADFKLLFEKAVVGILMVGSISSLEKQKNVINQLGFNSPFPAAVNQVVEFTKKRVQELTENDFRITTFPETFLDKDDLFQSEISFICYGYLKRWDLNARAYFDKHENEYKNNSLSEEDFLKANPKPWDIVNKILTEHGVDFKLKEFHRSDFNPEIVIKIELIKLSSGEQVSFEHLSSGEKTIIGLIIKLFTSEYYKQNLRFPDLLILDEPDAYLHPEMSKLLLEVLEQTFVKLYNINVIITTHSPSTVAMAPEDAIYELKNGPSSSLRKISKDKALKLLTHLIPNLSIDYKNHKQVFVESPTDVAYYQALHDRHQLTSQTRHNLYFISNAMGKGNSTLVYNIVDSIRNSGNQTSFGIVDWDLKNLSSPFVKVHGEGERYSIENFLLDPIYLTILLIEHNNAHGTLAKIGKDRYYNQYALGEAEESYLQSIVDLFFEEFERKFKVFKAKDSPTTIEYLNGKKISVPNWYLHTKGHDIHVKILKIFDGLEPKYSNEGTMQIALAQIMAKCYPFVPLASIQLIEEIQQ
jgi:predicted ATPase